MNNYNYSVEELEIVKEREYLLFKYNPGFCAMWHNNFEEYFKGTQDREYWKKQEEVRGKEIETKIQRNMIGNPEYASWRNELAIIEETLFGDPSESYVARSRWFEREQMMNEAEEESDRRDRKLKSDRLYQLSKVWSFEVLKFGEKAYEKNKDLDWFRILTNCLTVSGKIVFASGDCEGEHYDSKEGFLWRTDRIGYILSLASLQRCLESFRKIKEKDPQQKINSFIKDAFLIQSELINRLENINRKFLKLK
jgi:hypothetical protein